MTLEELLPEGNNDIFEFIEYGDLRGNIQLNRHRVKLSVDEKTIKYSESIEYTPETIDEHINQHKEYLDKLNEARNYIFQELFDGNSTTVRFNLKNKQINPRFKFLIKVQLMYSKFKSFLCRQDCYEAKIRKDIAKKNDYVSRLRFCKKIINYGKELIFDSLNYSAPREVMDKYGQLRDLNENISKVYENIIERYEQNIGELEKIIE